MSLPSDIPLQVHVPTGGGSPFAKAPARQPEAEVAAEGCVRAVLKYRNEEGRKAILSVAKMVHHDFGPFNESLAISLSPADLEGIKTNTNIDWFEGDGRVIYCSIR
ncbi:hypothetical protein ACHAXT_001031 [Thalassiosira profunda]